MTVEQKGRSISVAAHASDSNRASQGKLAGFFSVVFFFSGFSSLLYQVVWQRLLTTYYGVGATSVTVIVSIFMLGLGLGALLGGQLAKRFPSHAALSYLVAEALIAVFGVLSLSALSLLGAFTSGASLPVYLICIFAFLLLPTVLMGATLPLLTDIMTRLNSSFLSTVSSLYCVNTLGASCGAFFAAYVLISFWGLDTAVYTAVAINALLAISVAFVVPKVSRVWVDFDEPVSNETMGRWAYLCVFVTGFIAIGLEIVWFRTIELFVKSSPYAFATVLSIYLLGIASGSWLMNRFIHPYTRKNKRRLFALMQCAISAYVLLIYALMDTDSFKHLVRLSDMQELHPSFSLNIFHSFAAFESGWFAYCDILIWPVIFMLIPTVLMGASFPLISMLARSDGTAGDAISRVYFFNIVGNVFGGICTGFIFLQLLGTARTVLVLSLMSLPFLLMFVIDTWQSKPLRLALLSTVIAVTFVIVFCFPSSSKLMEAMHVPPSNNFRLDGQNAFSKNCKFYVEESANCVDVAYQDGDSVCHIINGLWHGGRLTFISGFYRRAIEGLSHAPERDNILVIGYGTGGIVEAILKDPTVKKLTLVELNSAVIVNLKKMELFQKLLADPRITLVLDDGRRYLLRTDTKYDAIFMDPLRSSTAYSNNIYSTEFFALVRNHLKPSGMMMCWLDNGDVLPRTIASQFINTKLYDSFCLASMRPLVQNKVLFSKLLENFDPAMRNSILKSENYLGANSYLEKSVKQLPINTDLKPVTEYYLGLLMREKLSHRISSGPK